MRAALFHCNEQAVDAVDIAESSPAKHRVVGKTGAVPSGSGILCRSTSLPLPASSVVRTAAAAAMAENSGFKSHKKAADSGIKSPNRISFNISRSFNNRVQPLP
jgi:hypothetical protein